MALQAFAVAVEHDAAVLHHIGVVGDLQGDGGALLDQQDGDAEFVADGGKPAGEILHDDRGKPEREFVDQQQLRPAHQCAGDRQHLPFAAGKQAADAPRSSASRGKK